MAYSTLRNEVEAATALEESDQWADALIAWTEVRHIAERSNRDDYRDLAVEHLRRLSAAEYHLRFRERRDAAVHRLLRVLSTGGIYNDDEMLLVLALRHEAAILSDLLNSALQPDVSALSEVDDLMVDVLLANPVSAQRAWNLFSRRSRHAALQQIALRGSVRTTAGH